MATIVNDKDKLLQATAVRLLSSPNNYIYFSNAAPVFNIDTLGVASPVNYTITAQLAGQLSNAGTVTWSVVSGTIATTGQSGNDWTIAATDLTTNTAVIRASLLYLGVTYSADLTVSKITSGAVAVFADLVSESDTIASEADGTGYILPTGNSLRLYSGGSLITTGVTYSGTATQNGLTLTIDSITGVITLSGTTWTSNQETFTVTATYNATAYTTTYSITKSRRGNDAVLLDLISDTDVVFANDNGLGYTLPTGNSLRLYKGGVVLTTGVTYSGTATKNGLTLTVNASTGELVLSGIAWTSNQESFTIVALYNALSYNITYTIAKSRAGASSLSAVLSNEAHVFNASTTGVVSSYVGSGTEIRVYEGATELTYNGVGTTAGTWKIATTATNITVGTITDSGTYATVGQHSGVAAGTDTSNILYTITGFSTSGVAFTITKNQTFSKSKIGTTGAIGTVTRVAYQLVSQTAGTPTYTASTVGSTTLPGASWSATVPTATVGNVIWYIYGQYNPNAFTSQGIAADTTLWSAPIAASIFQDIRSDNWNGSNPPTATTSTWGTNGYYINRTNGIMVANSFYARGKMQVEGNNADLLGTALKSNSTGAADIGVYGYSGGTAGRGVVGLGNTASSVGVLGTASGATSSSGVLAFATSGATTALTIQGGAFKTDNSTLVTNLNADLLDGKHAGNSVNQIPINNNTVCDSLVAGYLGFGANKYYLSGLATTGTATATLSTTTKPGANSTNTWLKVNINGTDYYLAVWPA